MTLTDEESLAVLQKVKSKAYELKRTLKESEFKKIVKEIKTGKK